MPQPNLQLVKEAIAAFNATDVEGFVALATDDFEWSPSMVAIEGQVFRGSEGIRAYCASLDDAWSEFRILPDSFRERGQTVLMLGALRGRGKNSGVTVDESLGMVFDIGDGKIARIRGFLDHAEALRASQA
ncbi:MAG TPA: nuclear transport factor 2 family protein [Solirubrobacteraceae bacterium]